ncbi:MAG: HD family phosphohydrolase [Verrucomicrobiales bacterium]
MFKYFKRNQLVRRGMACGKTRRKRSNSDFVRRLESAPGFRFLIFAGFLVGMVSLFTYDGGADLVKRLLTAFLIFLLALAQLWINHPESFARNSRLLLIFSVILAHLALAKVVLATVGNLDSLAWSQTVYVAIPYAFGPLLISALLGKNHALYAAIFISLWTSLLTFQVDAFLLVISLISGFVAVSITQQIRRRSRLIRAGFYVGAATWLLAVVFGLVGPFQAGQTSVDWSMAASQMLIALGAGVVTAMIVGGALPIFESVFDMTTDISWLEAADLNHPLLTDMSLRAPGTYYHSMAVAQLAEAAAEAIGANETICRVGAYFHDIGKLVKPEYFAENLNASRNPHDDLTPTMSALIIMAHVKEGVDLALRHRLNKTIIDMIQQHHGTSLVTYFYHRGLQQQEDARRGGKVMNMREEDIPEVKEETFRYSGPRPQFRESAILSLADSVESASRSLQKVTPQRIEQLVNDIIDSRIADHQLDDSNLTLNEIRLIAETLRSNLLSMMHSRIAYPKDDEEKATKTVEPKTDNPARTTKGSAA